MGIFSFLSGKSEITAEKKQEYINASTAQLKASMEKLEQTMEDPQLNATDKATSAMWGVMGVEPIIGGAAGAFGSSYLKKPVEHFTLSSFRTAHADSAQALHQVANASTDPARIRAYMQKAEEGLLKAGASEAETEVLAKAFVERLGKIGGKLGMIGLIGGTVAGAAWAMHKSNQDALETHRSDAITERKFVKQLLAEREKQASQETGTPAK